MPVAACFREDTDRTTNNNSCFVPHYVEPSTVQATDGAAAAPCCAHRELPMSANQRRLRSELYGTGAVASADYGAAIDVDPDDGSGSEERRSHSYHARCYGAGGYAGRGYSPTGGGAHGHSHSSSGGGHTAAADPAAKAARARGDAAAKANAAKAEQSRRASGVAAKRERMQSAAAQKMRADKMNVDPSARKAGSTGREPINRHAPPGSTGWSASTGGGS